MILREVVGLIKWGVGEFAKSEKEKIIEANSVAINDFNTSTLELSTAFTKNTEVIRNFNEKLKDFLTTTFPGGLIEDEVSVYYILVLIDNVEFGSRIPNSVKN